MKKRIWCVGLALFWYTLCVWGQEMDLFEQIALQQVSEDVGLEKNPPIQLPDVKLPLDKNPQQFSFSSSKTTLTDYQCVSTGCCTHVAKTKITIDNQHVTKSLQRNEFLPK